MTTSATPAMLRNEQAAAILGKCVKTLWNLERRGLLTRHTCPVTRRVFWDRAQVEALAARMPAR